MGFAVELILTGTFFCWETEE